MDSINKLIKKLAKQNHKKPKPMSPVETLEQVRWHMNHTMANHIAHLDISSQDVLKIIDGKK